MINSKTKWTELELVKLLKLDDFSEIYQLADWINYENHQNIVDIRAIVEFSNVCRRHCSYCGLNSRNVKVSRYRMSNQEVIETAIVANQAGYRTLVMQSGEDPYFTGESIAELVREIKQNTIDMAVTVSCGELSYEDYAKIRKAGADRYLLKHETSNPKIYLDLHDCGTLEKRILCLRQIKSLGYETGSGFMIGLPNQTLGTIAKDILLLKELNCDMAGIGPFIPSPNTELRNLPAGSPELTKRAVALTRILLPQANLPATTSLGVLDENQKNNIFNCGANVIMRKVTPQKYEECYSIYPNQIKVKDIKKERLDLEKTIYEMGKIPR